jgi:hypothetical protein
MKLISYFGSATFLQYINSKSDKPFDDLKYAFCLIIFWMQS